MADSDSFFDVAIHHHVCRAVGTSPRSGSMPLDLLPQQIPFDPPARSSPTLALSGGRLFAIGSDAKEGAGRGPGATVWQAILPTALDWGRERLLWLACLKNSRAECHLAKCPPHIIYKERPCQNILHRNCRLVAV